MRIVFLSLVLTLAPALTAAQTVAPAAPTATDLGSPSAPPAHAEQGSRVDFPGVPMSTPDLAFADVLDPNPGSGRRQILAGWISTGIGVASSVQVPFCRYNDYDDARGEQVCRRFSISMAVLGLAAGIPWLVFGYQRRAAQRQWRARHGLTGWFAPLRLAVQRDGASLLYEGVRF